MGKRWSHRNHPRAITERQRAIRSLPEWQDGDERIFDWAVDPKRLQSFQESLTGQMVMPVAMVGPAHINFAQYALDQEGNIRETDRYDDEVFIPLAHTEGGLSMSMQRGINVINAVGGVSTYILGDRMTRDSAFLFSDPNQAMKFYDWISENWLELQEWINDSQHPGKRSGRGPNQVTAVSRHARLIKVDAQVVGPACHLLYRFYTGEACGPNMMTRNAYALNKEILNRIRPLGIEPQQIFLEANMGGDKKPSHAFYNGGHGKTVLASVVIPHRTLRQHLNITAEELARLEWVGLHGANASGMQSVAFTPASAVAAIFLATGQDLGMVGTSSMAHGTVQRIEDGIGFSVQLGGLEVGTVGGGTSLPHAETYLRLMKCRGSGSSQRLAQIIGAAVLALEISASASMASHGSHNFYEAHFDRGGHR